MPDLLSSDPNATRLLSADPSAAVPSEGWGSRAWRWITTPLLPQIERAAHGMSDAITTPSLNASPLGSTLRGAAGGAIEGIGNVLGGFTSPLGIATSLAGPVLKGVTSGGGAANIAQLLTKPGELAGGAVDALDTRFAARPQGIRVPSSVDALSSFLRDPAITAPGEAAGGDVSALDPRFASARGGSFLSAEPAATDSSPFTRFEPTGGGVDPLDPRFSARPQGTAVAETRAPDPFASPLDHATQPSFADVPAAAPAPAAPRPSSPLDDLLGAFETPTPAETAARPATFDLGDMSADPLSGLSTTGDPLPPATPAAASPATTSPPSAVDTISNFFRRGESPVSSTGGRRLMPEEFTREQGLQATNLGEPRPIPAVPSAFTPMPEDPGVEWLTRANRYRDLPAAQRSAAIANDERFSHLLGDESGSVDPAALAEGANKLRYFSMLSSPATQAKNILGNVGAVAGHAAESTLSGRPRDAVNVLREFFNPQTVRDAIREYQTPEIGGRWDQAPGNSVLDIPGRIMGAIDSATKDALARGGVSSDTAKDITFTNAPKTDLGQAFNDLLQKHPIAKQVIPFSRTATNLVERGLERTPGIGYVAQRLSGGNLQTSIPKQILGAIAGAAGLKTQSKSPFLDALLAPYSLPYAIGAGMGRAAKKVGSTSADVLSGATKAFQQAAPLPNDYSLDPRQWLASYVPNILRDVGQATGTDPATFDTSHGLTDAAIAKIPLLNEILLHHKAHAPRAPSAR